MRNMKLILEGWRAISTLNEQEEQGIPADKVSLALDNVFSTVSYADFVTKLSKIAGDPKVKAVLSAGITDGAPEDEQVKITKINIKVSDLRPTQNEVDLDKSLSFPLTKPEAFLNCFKSPVTVNNTPIVTAEGQYVVDGHHRWSQVYSINPDAEMVAYNLSFANQKEPLDYLKIVQVAIAADIGKVPVQAVKGQNLFTIDLGKPLKSWIYKTTAQNLEFFMNPSNQVAERLKINSPMTDKSTVVTGLHEAISRNITQMRQTSQPVEGAPPRTYMPQTDDAGNWIEFVTKGAANFIDPKSEDAKESGTSSDASGKAATLQIPADKVQDAKRVLTKAGIIQPQGVTAESIRRIVRQTIQEQLRKSTNKKR